MKLKTLKIIYLVFGLIMAMDCERKEARDSLTKIKKHSKEINIKQSGESHKSLNDPYIVKENSVIFLVLSKDEYNAYSPKEQYEIDEVIDDFDFYANRTVDWLIKNGISPILTPNKNLHFLYNDGRIEKLYFDTKISGVAVALFGKGKKPIIHYGPVQDTDIYEMVADYFGIEIKLLER